jgi:hypothetical protein
MPLRSMPYLFHLLFFGKKHLLFFGERAFVISWGKTI